MSEETTAEKVKHNSLSAALAAAQSEMGAAKKTSNNPHFKSKYADLDAVCDAVMPALNRHGIAVVQPLQAVEGDWLVVTRFIHADSADVIEGPVPLIIGKKDMQGLGSAITYARRYGLMCLAGIAPEDDDGHDAGQGNGEPFRQQGNQARGPQQPSAEAITQAVNYLTAAADLNDLRVRFRNIPPNVRGHADVIAAKDARKDALTPATDGDEIPH